MIEKKTILSRLEVNEDWTIGVRLGKRIVDGNEILLTHFHRVLIVPGDDFVRKMNLVNDHLESMGWPAFSDLDRVKEVVELTHTPEVVAAYKARMRLQE